VCAEDGDICDVIPHWRIVNAIDHCTKTIMNLSAIIISIRKEEEGLYRASVIEGTVPRKCNN